MKTRITVLGCGGSGGVPYVGNVWGNCDPNNPKNHRLRPSILIEKGDTHVVVDTGPDFRTQLNRINMTSVLDAVLYTHAHFDHINGIDDLRSFWFRRNKVPVPVYASEQTANDLEKRFDYIFHQLAPKYPPTAQMNHLERGNKIKDLELLSFEQMDGDLKTTGFRIGDFAYCTDVKTLPEPSLRMLKGIKTWIVGVFPDAGGQYNHAGFDQLNAWIDRLQPKMTYLTHLNATADYDTLGRQLPPHIRPAYDGLEIVL